MYGNLKVTSEPVEFDHWDLPFDLAQGGEPAEPFEPAPASLPVCKPKGWKRARRSYPSESATGSAEYVKKSGVSIRGYKNCLCLSGLGQRLVFLCSEFSRFSFTGDFRKYSQLPG